MTRPWTPPAVKWTANELAALKGELQVIEQELGALRLRREVVRGRIDALEQVFSMVAPEVPLVHVPVVHAQKRFGGYGNLRGWLLSTLEAAYPQALDTVALLDGAERVFGLTFESKGARGRFRDNSLAKALRVAAAAGEVERMETSTRFSTPGVWRWRPPQSVLAELRAVAQDEAG
ncbi:MAG: hypothetical protein JNK17_17695 [Hydrogenophaga sp.]|nr:hypothetical protein [Hydrogenophaga sp.]